MSGRAFWLLAVIFLLALLYGCISQPDTVRVIRVIDGDTITIEGGYRVRYIGIDTPELLEDFGQEAWQANCELVEGKVVRLERDMSETDKYGRLLRYVYVDDIFVNADLVKQGMAEAKAYPPGIKYQDYLEDLEQEARRADRGMWTK